MSLGQPGRATEDHFSCFFGVIRASQLIVFFAEGFFGGLQDVWGF